MRSSRRAARGVRRLLDAAGCPAARPCLRAPRRRAPRPGTRGLRPHRGAAVPHRSSRSRIAASCGARDRRRAHPLGPAAPRRARRALRRRLPGDVVPAAHARDGTLRRMPRRPAGSSPSRASTSPPGPTRRCARQRRDAPRRTAAGASPRRCCARSLPAARRRRDRDDRAQRRGGQRRRQSRCTAASASRRSAASTRSGSPGSAGTRPEHRGRSGASPAAGVEPLGRLVRQPAPAASSRPPCRTQPGRHRSPIEHRARRCHRPRSQTDDAPRATRSSRRRDGSQPIAARSRSPRARAPRRSRPCARVLGEAELSITSPCSRPGRVPCGSLPPTCVAPAGVLAVTRRAPTGARSGGRCGRAATTSSLSAARRASAREALERRHDHVRLRSTCSNRPWTSSNGSPRTIARCRS